MEEIFGNITINDTSQREHFIQKFQYLVTSLNGSAAKVIETVELTNAKKAIQISKCYKKKKTHSMPLHPR